MGNIDVSTLNDYLKNKYGIDQRQALIDQNADEASQPNYRAGLAALGAGLSGGDAVAAGQGVLKTSQAARDNRLAQFDAGKQNVLDNYNTQKTLRTENEQNDPNSMTAKLNRLTAIKLGYKPEDVANASTAQLSPLLDERGKLYVSDNSLAEKRLEGQEKSADRKLAIQQRDDAAQGKLDAASESAKTKKGSDQEFINNHGVIERELPKNIQKLQDIIDTGTTQLTGDGRMKWGNLNRVIATDLSRLEDPQGRISPMKIKLIEDNLPKPGFPQKASSLISGLEDLKDEANGRINSAYDARGLVRQPLKSLNTQDKTPDEDPNTWDQQAAAEKQGKSSSPNTITQNGHKYFLNQRTGKYE